MDHPGKMTSITTRHLPILDGEETVPTLTELRPLTGEVALAADGETFKSKDSEEDVGEEGSKIRVLEGGVEDGEETSTATIEEAAKVILKTIVLGAAAEDS